MPDLLLDSDVIIEVLRENLNLIEELKRLRQEGWLIAYTPIAKAEIYHGLKRDEENVAEYFFAACRSLAITDAVGERAGRYLASYHKSHGLQLADALIAASAFVYKTTLFTLNTKHYPMKDIQIHCME